jgi:hypothetical protein
VKKQARDRSAANPFYLGAVVFLSMLASLNKQA